MMPFVVLEGCDGSGKTTLREMLRLELNAGGFKTVTVGQHSWLHPWYSRALIAARENRRKTPLHILSDAYLHDKHLHGRRNVIPARSNAIVLADRWFYSDAVYHAALYGIPLEQTLKSHLEAGTEVPQLLVYVEVESDLAYERILSRGKHTRHYEKPTDLRRILYSYSELLNSNLVDNVRVIRIKNKASLDELRLRVKETLMPAICKMLASKEAHR